MLFEPFLGALATPRQCIGCQLGDMNGRFSVHKLGNLRELQNKMKSFFPGIDLDESVVNQHGEGHYFLIFMPIACKSVGLWG